VLVSVYTFHKMFFMLIPGFIAITGCVDSPTPASPNDAPADPFVVTATVPGLVSRKDTYPLIGSSSHPATSWTWERSYNGGPFRFWASSQNAWFVAYAGKHHLQWRLTAKRVADDITDTDVRTTDICIGSRCTGSGLPPLQ
jgi:hypothetical protein